MFSIFKKDKVIKPIINSSESVIIEKKHSRIKQVNFIDSNGKRHEGFVLKTIKVTKGVPSNLYIVSVVKVNDFKVKPYLKWINDIYCNDITTLNISDYNKNIFKLDWMKENAKTK